MAAIGRGLSAGRTTIDVELNAVTSTIRMLPGSGNEDDPTGADRVGAREVYIPRLDDTYDCRCSGTAMVFVRSSGGDAIVETAAISGSARLRMAGLDGLLTAVTR